MLWTYYGGLIELEGKAIVTLDGGAANSESVPLYEIWCESSCSGYWS